MCSTISTYPQCLPITSIMNVRWWEYAVEAIASIASVMRCKAESVPIVMSVPQKSLSIEPTMPAICRCANFVCWSFVIWPKIDKLDYSVTLQFNLKCVHEEIKMQMQSWNACYHLIFFYSSLLSKNIKIIIYRTIALLAVLYGCENLSLTIRKEHRLRDLDNRVMRKTFSPKREKVTQEWRRLHNEKLYNLCTPHTLLSGWSNQEEW